MNLMMRYIRWSLEMNEQKIKGAIRFRIEPIQDYATRASELAGEYVKKAIVVCDYGRPGD